MKRKESCKKQEEVQHTFLKEKVFFLIFTRNVTLITFGMKMVYFPNISKSALYKKLALNSVYYFF